MQWQIVKIDLVWTPEACCAFEKCKESLTKFCELAYSVVNAQLHLVCDVSNKAIGSSLNQFDFESMTWKPLAFFFKALNPCQKVILHMIENCCRCLYQLAIFWICF